LIGYVWHLFTLYARIKFKPFLNTYTDCEHHTCYTHRHHNLNFDKHANKKSVCKVCILFIVNINTDLLKSQPTETGSMPPSRERVCSHLNLEGQDLARHNNRQNALAEGGNQIGIPSRYIQDRSALSANYDGYGQYWVLW